MNLIYNTQEEIASKIKQKLKEIIPDIRKTVLNILPYIFIGMLNSESVVASDISKSLKDDFSLVQHDSVVKRIRRFFKINYLILIFSTTKLFALSFKIIRKNISIKKFILFLIICFLKIIIRFL